MKRLLVSLVSVVAALGTAGCARNPTFTPMSHAPPGAVADYFQDTSIDARTIRITEGIAFALECADWEGSPCTFEGTTTADDSIASVRRAYGDLDQRLVAGSQPTQTAERTRTLFVVIGHRIGETALTVKTGTRDALIHVEVVAAN